MDSKGSHLDSTMTNRQSESNDGKQQALTKGEESYQGKKKSPIVEIVDFDLTTIKQETDNKFEEQTMELELKVEIEPDSESSSRLHDPEPSSSKNEHADILMHRDKHQNDHSEGGKLLPPPLISKPVGTTSGPQSSSHSLQPPPLMINPRLSNEGRAQNFGIVDHANNAMDDEILKIKKEIRDDIQSDLMNTSGEMGGIGNAVAASLMNSFQPSKGRDESDLDKQGSGNNSERINALTIPRASTMQSLQTNTTSLLPRSITNNQMYISRINSLITTSSYVNLPLCTPNATVSLGPRSAHNVMKDIGASNPLRIITSVGSTSIQQGTTKNPQLQNILQARPANGTHFPLQGSNRNTAIYNHPSHNIQILQQQMYNGDNGVKPGVIGTDVRERLVKHLEDKNGEVLVQGPTNDIPRHEIPPLVQYNSDGQYSPSPTTPTKSSGRI